MAKPTLSEELARIDLYEETGKYKEALELAKSLYTKHKVRPVLRELITLSMKTEDSANAEVYLARYIEKAPDDSSVHLFRYELDQLEGKNEATLIKDLQAINNDYYTDKYGYDLISLYFKTSDRANLVKECERFLNWFPESEYAGKVCEISGLSIPKKENAAEDSEDFTKEISEVSETTEISETTDFSEVSKAPAVSGSKENKECNSESEVEESTEKVTEIPPADSLQESLQNSLQSSCKDSLKDTSTSEDITMTEATAPETTAPEAEADPYSYACEDYKKPQFALAVSILKDDDYILTKADLDRIYAIVSSVADDPFSATITEEQVNDIITDKIKAVIKKAEDRNMASLYSIVMRGAYENSGLLRLAAEDFEA